MEDGLTGQPMVPVQLPVVEAIRYEPNHALIPPLQMEDQTAKVQPQRVRHATRMLVHW